MRFKDKTAVITGAAEGIGLACAERLAQEGARVILADINMEVGEKIAETLRKSGLVADFVQCDVGYRDQVERMLDVATQKHDSLDILVNNAAVSKPADFLDYKEEDFDNIIRTNLKSVFLCGQGAARRMAAQGRGGAIINMSSINAVVVIPTGAPYAAAKGGINQLTKLMAIGLAAHRIRVNGVGPGTIETGLTRRGVLANEESARRIYSRTPMGRAGQPSEIAAIVAFLASDDASYITGHTIYADGGRLGLNLTVPIAT